MNPECCANTVISIVVKCLKFISVPTQLCDQGIVTIFNALKVKKLV